MNISKSSLYRWTLGVNDIPGNIFADCLNNNGEDARKDMKLLSLMWVTNPHQDNSLQEGLWYWYECIFWTQISDKVEQKSKNLRDDIVEMGGENESNDFLI